MPSAQVVGQAPGRPAAIATSQVSPLPGWTTPSPQVAEQSGSVAAVQPPAQQPSRVGEHVVICVISQRAVQVAASPTSALTRQADGGRGQVLGHAPAPVAALSHDSPISTTPLPHEGWQSPSVRWVAPAGQQPSPETSAVMGVLTHRT